MDGWVESTFIEAGWREQGERIVEGKLGREITFEI